MSFIFNLSPFRGQSQGSQPSSPTSERLGRRQLTRELQCALLESPFRTPSKEPSPTSSFISRDPSSSSNGKMAHDAIRDAKIGQGSPLSIARSASESYFQQQAQSSTSADMPGGHGNDPIDFLRLLPHELALLVILHLETHKDLLFASQVSRTWRNFATDPQVWKEFFHRNMGWALRGDDEVESCLTQLQDDLVLPKNDSVYDLSSIRQSLDFGASTPVKGKGRTGHFTGVQIDSILLGSPATSPAPSNWWRSRSGNVPQHSSSKQRLVDRLDWRKVYAARYRLAARWGEVGPTSVHRAQKRRRQWPREASRSSSRSITEDWEDSAEEGSSNSSRSGLLRDSDDDQVRATRFAEAESAAAVAATLASPRSASLPRPQPRPEARVFGSHPDSIYCARVFPSYNQYALTSGYLVTGSKDCNIRVWALSENRCMHILRGHRGSVLSVDIDSAGEILVSGSSDRQVGIWSWFGCPEAIQCARQGKAWKPSLLEMWDLNVSVMDVRLSAKYMVIGLRNGQVRCYARPTPTTFQKVSVYDAHQCSLNDMKIQGDQLALGYAHGYLEIIDIPTGHKAQSFPIHKGVSCVEFAGDVVIAATSDGKIRLWQASTSRLLMVLHGHLELPRAIHFDGDRGMLISVGYDGLVSMWDTTLLLDSHRVKHNALGASWKALGWQWREQKLALEAKEEEKQGAMSRIQQRRSESVDDRLRDDDSNHATDGGSTSEYPAPHPLAEPPTKYRPRWSARILYHRSQAVHDGHRDTTVIRVTQSHDDSLFLPDSHGSFARLAHPASRSNPSSNLSPSGSADPPPHPPRHGLPSLGLAPLDSLPTPGRCRLFDVAFDGKRIVVVGELAEIVVFEALDNKVTLTRTSSVASNGSHQGTAAPPLAAEINGEAPLSLPLPPMHPKAPSTQVEDTATAVAIDTNTGSPPTTTTETKHSLHAQSEVSERDWLGWEIFAFAT